LLTVVTGVPNAGKSEFIDQLMVNLAERAGWSFSLCSFENPPHIHIHKLVAKRLRLNTWKKKVDEKDFNEAKWWVQQHFSFLYDSDGNLSSLDSIIDRLRVAVMRYGIRGVVIDPYNYIQRPRDSTETDWISDMLTKIKTFAMAHGVHVWFCAHPTKMQPVDGGKIAIPTGYNISGSAHFFNKADCGLTVHREEGNELVQIKVWKMRFAWQGKLGKVSLLYDRDTTTYSDGNGNFEALDDGEAWI
jgi:twinkle protein